MLPILKRTATGLGMFVIVAILGGCTANVSSADKNGLIPHLTVDLQVAANIESGDVRTFSIEVKQGDQPFEDAEQVEFEVWPEENKEATMILSGQKKGPGIYSVNQTFAEEGLYIVKCRVTSKDYQLMPSKRFAVGDVALQQLVIKEQQSEPGALAPTETGGHHH
ncbi:FixH family protein [Paenibacillus eucommiae]|uniref:YtkA-like domain-containing protein n=1 Tax=Paenibacillus eucommiae TaxID=1355755 RepID=A0ABS4ISF8_9BACL|nr:FixH family protein [Paenibacillus eucommiae]MBP1989519.1 hypothetical protein [Paenibacillus eucommiae]